MTGTTLGHYRIVELLGRGGMGEVYLADDTKLQRQVALKVLSPELARDVDRRQRFEREARAAAALNHPNIVTIHSVEEVDGVAFLTMELVDGQTLGQLTPAEGFTLDRLLALAIPLTDAVGAAHQRGITHRDLKPANVMVSREGRVKVLDFGLAKLKEEVRADADSALPTAELTGEGRILGTVAYMSPEQAEGRHVDPRTDVFALGVMLYEMATGTRPFKGDTQLSLLSSIIRDTPSSVTELRRDLPRDLGRIIKRCLAKDPEDRYQTAKDLRNDLRGLKDDLTSGELAPVGASAERSAAPAAPPAPAGRRVTWLHWAGVAFALAAVAGAGWVWRGRTNPRPATAPATSPFDAITLSRLTTSGTAGLAALSGDGRYVAHVVTDEGKQSLWLRQVATSSNVQIVPPAETNYDGLAFAPDGDYVYYSAYPRGENYASLYRVPVLGGVARKVLEDLDTAVTFAPDGKRLAFVRGFPETGGAGVFVGDAEGGNVRQLAVRKAPLVFDLDAIAWSPDGRVLATTGHRQGQLGSEVVLLDATSGTEQVLGAQQWRQIHHLAWLPDGSGLLVNGQESAGESSSQVSLLTHPGGEVKPVTNDLSEYVGLSVARDGRSFVTVRGELRSSLWLVPAGDAKAARVISSGAGTDDGVLGVAWTPDGRIVYTSSAGGNPDLWVMDPDGSNRLQLTAEPGPDTWPLVTPDGRTIVFVSERDGNRGLWRIDSDGSRPMRIGSDRVARRPSLSGDGAWVFYSNGDGKIVRVSLDGKTSAVVFDPATAKALPPGFHEPMPSPDGTVLAGHYSDMEQRGERIALVPNGAAGPPRLFPALPPNARWSADGRSLIYFDTRRGVSNIWRQGASGGDPAQVTGFTTDQIFAYATPIAQHPLAVVRGTVISDVVLIADRHR